MKIYNILRFALISTSLLVVTSCANIGDSATDLGDGYVYRVDGDQRWIRAGNIMQDGVYPNVIDYKFNTDYVLVIQEPTLKGYSRFLAQDLRYKYESIIYKPDTSKNDAYKERVLKSHLWTDSSIHARVTKEMKPDNQTSFETLDLIADSLVKFDPSIKSNFERKRNYWIILKKKSIILGPYSKTQYQHQRNKLNVPGNLRLEK
jgi:hypothetical protein